MRTTFGHPLGPKSREKEREKPATSQEMCKPDQAKPTTLFERLGGVEAVRAAVNELYKRILADPKLKGFFDNTTMTALRLHQLEFMKIAFTEIPQDLDVAALLTEKHKSLFGRGLNGEHFDLVAGHFVESLQHLGVNQELIDEAAGVVLPLRGVFVEGAEKYGEAAKASESQAAHHVLHAKDPKEVSLTERLGGIPALKAAVEEFYKRILEDPDLAFFFEDTTMTSLKMHQLAFMQVAFTQIPEDLDVLAMMKEKHENLFAKGLKASHFDKVARHFVGTLESLSVPKELIDECVSVIAPLRVVFEQSAC